MPVSTARSDVTTALEKLESRGRVKVSMFMSIDDAADYFGIASEAIREYVNREIKPMPHIKRGRNKLVCMTLAAEYLEEEALKSG